VRTVFVGTTDYAAGILRALAGSPHRPAFVLTRPDRPKGRGRRLASPPVAAAARALGIPVEQPARVNTPDLSAQIRDAEADIVVVCAFGALISEPLLSEHELLNVHPSLLPRWRGAAPIERAIMAGDRCTGVSIMRITAGLDSGPVCLAAAEPVGAADDYGSLAERLQDLGGELLLSALEGPRHYQEQDDALASYAEKIGSEDRLLDPSKSAVELERYVRALHPHIGARVRLNDGTMLGVHRAALAPGEHPIEDHGVASAGQLGGAGADSAPTLGVQAVGERLLLECRPGVLELLVVQPPGGRPMDAASYVRGHFPPRST
jgi:methionyl-tRNA formyltransferase